MVGGLGTAPDSRIGTGTPLPRGPCLSVTAGRVTQRRAGPLGPWNCHKWKFSNPNALSWRPKVSHRGMGQFLPPRPSTHWRCTPALNPQPRLWGSEREHPVPEQLQEMHRLAAGIAAMAMGHNSNNNSDLSMDSVYYHSPNLADQLMETLDGIPVSVCCELLLPDSFESLLFAMSWMTMRVPLKCFRGRDPAA